MFRTSRGSSAREARENLAARRQYWTIAGGLSHARYARALGRTEEGSLLASRAPRKTPEHPNKKRSIQTSEKLAKSLEDCSWEALGASWALCRSFWASWGLLALIWGLLGRPGAHFGCPGAFLSRKPPGPRQIRGFRGLQATKPRNVRDFVPWNP